MNFYATRAPRRQRGIYNAITLLFLLMFEPFFLAVLDIMKRIENGEIFSSIIVISFIYEINWLNKNSLVAVLG